MDNGASASRVNCKCVFCGEVETFSPIPTEIPMCLKCYSPMYVVSVEARLTEVGTTATE